LKKNFLTLKIVIIVNNFFAQNYQNYYSKIDSANYYKAIDYPVKSDSLYENAFLNFDGFSEHYLMASSNIYKIDRNKSLSYLKKAVFYGEHRKNLKYHVKKQKINFSKKEIRKLYRQKKRKLTSNFPILNMVMRDALARHSKKNTQYKMRRADSINYVKIIRLMKTKPNVINRFYHNEITNQWIELLLIHQKFSTLKKDWSLFYSYVEKGKLNRFFLGNVVERDAMWGGKTFKVNTQINTIELSNTLNSKFKNGFLYCSALGSISFFLKGDQVIIPINPYTKPQEYNALRSYLFLSDYELYKKTYQNTFVFPNIEGFENYLKTDDINYKRS